MENLSLFTGFQHHPRWFSRRISEPSTVYVHGFHHVDVCTLFLRMPGDLDRGYLVRLRTHQVTRSWCLDIEGAIWVNQNGNLQYLGCHEIFYPFFLGIKLDANQWWFWGISLITNNNALFGLVSYFMTPDTPIGKPWFRNWLWRCEADLFFKLQGSFQTFKYREIHPKDVFRDAMARCPSWQKNRCGLQLRQSWKEKLEIYTSSTETTRL